MSGGRLNYQNDAVCTELFNGASAYDGWNGAAYARARNPMEDKQLSELIFDVFVLLHSWDWYQSGDTGEEDYREDVEYFKKKWLKKSSDDLAKREIENAIAELRRDLYISLCLDREVPDGDSR